MKKLISLVLCAVMAAGSAVCANAAELPAHKGVKILNSTIQVKNNTLSVYTYNMNRSTTGGIMMEGVQSGKTYQVDFADCISAPKTLTLPSGESYSCYGIADCNFRINFLTAQKTLCAVFLLFSCFKMNIFNKYSLKYTFYAKSVQKNEYSFFVYIYKLMDIMKIIVRNKVEFAVKIYSLSAE